VRALAALLAAALCLSAGAAMARADWSGDQRADVLAVDAAGKLLMYRGTGGDGRPDLLARTTDGLLLLYRGDGSGGFLTGSGEQIGTG
jgi:hypothetical protein